MRSKVLTCMDIECLVAQMFGIRSHIIVPNVSWGFNIHECDLLIISKSNWAYEVEIKVSKSDLKKDTSKKHGHVSNRIKYLYFAIPEKLESSIDLIPERAGIIIIRENKFVSGDFYTELIRQPQANKEAVKLTDKDVKQISRLGAMRIWALKYTISNLLKYKHDSKTKERMGAKVSA